MTVSSIDITSGMYMIYREHTLYIIEEIMPSRLLCRCINLETKEEEILKLEHFKPYFLQAGDSFRYGNEPKKYTVAELKVRPSKTIVLFVSEITDQGIQQTMLLSKENIEGIRLL